MPGNSSSPAELPRRPLSLEQAFTKYLALTDSQTYERADTMNIMVSKLEPESLLAVIIVTLKERSYGVANSEKLLTRMSMDIRGACTRAFEVFNHNKPRTRDEAMQIQDLRKIEKLADLFTRLAFKIRNDKNHKKCNEGLEKIKKALTSKKKDFLEFEL